MRKNLKAIVAVLLATTMVGSLAGCGNNSKGDKGSENNTAATVTPSAESNSTDEVTGTEMNTTDTLNAFFSKYPAIDMDGRTIKIAMFYDAYYDSNDTVPEDNPNVSNVETAQRRIDNIRRIEEKYNCRIELVNPGSDALVDSLNTSVVAGTPDYDVYLTQMSFGLPLAVNGYFEDLSTLSKDYEDIKNGSNIVNVFNVAGTNCFFEKKTINLSANYLVYNADMLKQLGLEDPNELYQKGEWTWDKFEELCTAAVQDTDNNGVTDIYGYGGDVSMTLTEFLASNDATLVKDENKEGVTDPKALEVFQFLSKLYNDDSAAKPATDNYDENIYAWTKGQCVFSPTQLWILQTAGEISFQYHIVPWPKGPSGDGTKAGQTFGDYFVIPKGVKDADKVYQIIEEYFGWYGDDYASRDGDSIELAEGCFVDENDVDTSFKIGEMGNADIWSILDTDYIISGIFNDVCITKKMTASQAVESKKQLFQDEINKILK